MDSLIDPHLRPGVNADAIALSNVNLSLGSGAARVHILKDISLQIASGSAVGLIGPSGSGKSTLLMIMAGLERPDRGEVVVDGTSFNALDEDALARFRGRNVGIVFQSFHLIPTMTALENVAVPLELARDSDAHARAEQELASVGLGERLHHYPVAALRRRTAARRAGARARAGSGDPARRRADRKSRRDDRQADHRSAVRQACRARHDAGAGHARSWRWQIAATAWCGCARAASTPKRPAKAAPVSPKP